MNVAIIGAGIGGAAAALLLAKRGARVTVFERVLTPRPVGAGLLLQPSGMAVLAELGVLGPVLERGERVHRLRGLTPSGRTVLSLHYADRRPDLFGLGVHRGSLFTALFEALPAAGVTVRTGVSIERLNSGADGLWRLAPDDSPFDLVVVADGARSTLREQVGRVKRARVYPYGALWFIADDPEDLFGEELFQIYRGTGQMLGFLPSGLCTGDPVRKTSVFWSLPIAQEPAIRREGLDAWRVRALSLHPAAAPLLDQARRVDELVLATYHDVVMRETHRVTAAGAGAVVIGDAAHAMSPQLGQGANLALLDASALVSALTAHDAFTSRQRLPVALTAYEASRRGPVRAYQQLSRWLTPVFQSDWPIVGSLRDWFMGSLCRVPPVRRLMLDALAGGKRSLLSAYEPPRLLLGATE